MLANFHSRFGVPGVIALVALVFAMTGGAYASTKVLITSTKQISPKVLKQLKGAKGVAGAKGADGAAGPAGPKGDAGPAGSKGDAGGNGSSGSNGTPGKSVLSGTAAPTGATGSDGDFYIRTTTSQIYGPKTAGAWSGPTNLKGADGVDGAPGSPWTAGGTLPQGSTETGVWGPHSDAGVPGLVSDGTSFATSVSFLIPTASAPTAVVVPPSGTFSGYGADTAAGCPGVTDGIATADPGKLCLYTQDTNIGLNVPASDVTTASPTYGASGNASRAGALLDSSCSDPGHIGCMASGLWAVTGN